MVDTAQRVGEARRLERVGRRLRLGIVGGGLDSTIGPVHYVAARVDGCFDLVAGALSNDPEIAVSSGRALLMDPERIYTDYREMARRECEREDPIDAVVIATRPRRTRRSPRSSSTTTSMCSARSRFAPPSRRPRS